LWEAEAKALADKAKVEWKPVFERLRPQAIICDHDAEDRATLEASLGISTALAKKQIKPGIEAVSVRLRKAGDGKPRIFFLRDSRDGLDELLDEAKRPVATEEEFDCYVWNDKVIKDMPKDENNHGLDATRYMVMHLDSPGMAYEAPSSLPAAPRPEPNPQDHFRFQDQGGGPRGRPLYGRRR
jgi:hypothetical protein